MVQAVLGVAGGDVGCCGEQHSLRLLHAGGSQCRRQCRTPLEAGVPRWLCSGGRQEREGWWGRTKQPGFGLCC